MSAAFICLLVIAGLMFLIFILTLAKMILKKSLGIYTADDLYMPIVAVVATVIVVLGAVYVKKIDDRENSLPPQTAVVTLPSGEVCKLSQDEYKTSFGWLIFELDDVEYKIPLEAVTFTRDLKEQVD